jgi:hypothetical protein
MNPFHIFRAAAHGNMQRDVRMATCIRWSQFTHVVFHNEDRLAINALAGHWIGSPSWVGDPGREITLHKKQIKEGEKLHQLYIAKADKYGQIMKMKDLIDNES